MSRGGESNVWSLQDLDAVYPETPEWRDRNNAARETTQVDEHYNPLEPQGERNDGEGEENSGEEPRCTIDWSWLSKPWGELHPIVPIITGSIGVMLVISGVTLAAIPVKEAMIPVVTSNLPMVLALSGAALIIPSIFVLNNCLVLQNPPDKLIFIIDLIVIALTAAIGYGAIHHGMGAALATTSLGTWESVSIQAAAGFVLGAALTVGVLTLAYYSAANTPEDLNAAMRNDRKFLLIFAPIAGLLCAATTAVGPALSLAMGAAAAENAAASISMEVLISLGFAALMITAAAGVAGYTAIGGGDIRNQTDVQRQPNRDDHQHHQ